MIPWSWSSHQKYELQSKELLGDFQLKGLGENSAVEQEKALRHVQNLRRKYFFQNKDLNFEQSEQERSEQLSLCLEKGELEKILNSRSLRQLTGVFHEVLQIPPKLRESPMKIRDLQGQIQDSDFPPPDILTSALKVYQAWLFDNHPAQPLLTAWGQHAILLAIHPYEDGNGRLARLLEWNLMPAALRSYRIFPELIDHLYYENYQEALLETRKQGRLDAFFEYRLKCWSEQLHQAQGALGTNRARELRSTNSSFSLSDT